MQPLIQRLLTLIVLLLTCPSLAQTLRVTTAPAGASVEIDGVNVGRTPLTREVAAGSRTVRLRRAGFATWERPVDVAAEGTTDLDIALDQLMGTLVLDGLPAEATVTAGGLEVGQTTRIGVGFNDVAVRIPGRPDARRRVPVGDGRVTQVTYRSRQFEPVWAATSLAAPGVVQMADRRPIAGAAFLIGTATALGVGWRSDAAIRDSRLDYDRAVASYREAASESEVERALTQIDQHVQRADRLQSTRRAAIGAGIVLYLAGAVDALVHHAWRPGLRASAPALPPVSVHLQPDGLSLAVHL